LAGAFPTSDETDWSVGVSLTLPLFQGGERFSEQKRVFHELARLRLERAAVKERIDQRIQAAVIKTEVSFPSIQLSRDAAEASGKNLELVMDSYSRGVVSILDLLDAQNASLVTEQAAANAVYDFLIDLMEVQRAANLFDFFTSPEERESWFSRMKAFFLEKEGEAR
jgi:outer membrane protein TolC